MTFTDSLSQPVTLVSPADGAPGTGTLMSSGKVSNITLDWEAAGGATEYQWQVDSDTEFSNVPSDLDGTTKSSSVRLPSLETAARYYWRVKASQPVTSPWSGKWSFTTTIGGETIAPVLSTPEAGAVGVPTSPIFQWSTIADASRYELLVSTDAAFGNPTVAKLGDYALPSTAWQCNINLNYDTTYYWKVRAIGSGTQSAWSAVGAFNTESPPADKEPLTITPTPQTVTSPPSSPPIVQPAIPEWIVYLMGALLLTIILLLIIVLLLVVGIRRL
jgi:hypothetical protein